MVIERAMVRMGPRLSAVLMAASAGGCVRAPPSPPAGAAADTCLVIPPAVTPAETLTVAVNEAVDPDHVPVPRNAAEAVVFAHLYETPLRLDCRGGVVPGFATVEPLPSGVEWRLSLRNALAFWNGRPATARDVLDAWAGAGLHLAAAPADGAVVLARADGERDPPTFLASPAYALYAADGEGVPPAGTGSTAPPAVAGARGPDFLLARPRALRFLVRPTMDARDLLDLGADVVIAGDRAALDYAASRPDLTVVPLPWTRTYVVFAEWSDRLAGAIDGLARDVVPVDARPAEGPFWWEDPACAALPATGPAGGGLPHIIYDRADPVGRALAERLVVRAPAAGARAVGLDASVVERRLRDGGVYAVVTVLPRAAPAVCDERPVWASPPPRALVDVRQSLIVRPGAGPVWVDGHGLPRFGEMR